MPEIHARTCHLCEANCGVLMTVEDGKVTKVTGNPDHVLSEGQRLGRCFLAIPMFIIIQVVFLRAASLRLGARRVFIRHQR